MKWIQRWKAKQEREREIAYHEKMIRKYEREIRAYASWPNLGPATRENSLPMIAYHRGRIEELMSE